MKISPMPSAPMNTIDQQGVQQPMSKVDALRSIRIQTNRTTPTYQGQSPVEQVSPDNIEQPKTSVEATQPLSPQLALLAKQRRALQVKERELQRKERELSERTGTTHIDVARLKSEPLKVLLENDVTYDQLTEAIMSGQGNSEIYALKKEIEALKQGVDKRFSDSAAQSEQQVIKEMNREAQLLSQDDQYELIRETRSVPTVMDLILRTYKESGEVLDVPEAMRLVEEELLNEAQRIARSKKMQSQLQSPMAQPQQRQNVGMRTLTNKDTATASMSAKQRALAAFYGQLQR